MSACALLFVCISLSASSAGGQFGKVPVPPPPPLDDEAPDIYSDLPTEARAGPDLDPHIDTDGLYDIRMQRTVHDHLQSSKRNSRSVENYIYFNTDLFFKYVNSDGRISDTYRNNTIEIKATPLTSDTAHHKAAYIIGQMVKDMSPEFFEILARDTSAAVFTATEGLTSFNDYHPFADTPLCAGSCAGMCDVTCTYDGRKYSYIAGAGGRMATVVDDNVMCSSQDPYRRRYSVLIHEYAHTIHEYAVSENLTDRITSAYDKAREIETWPLDSYAMYDELEYFAQGTSVFFNADHIYQGGELMNGCHRRRRRTCWTITEARSRLMERDPGLFDILTEIYTNSRSYMPSSLGTCVLGI